jgi:Cdc6-like AAA superfamily ATPase
LKPKIQSRFGKNQIIYHQYKNVQISKIIENRLEGLRAVFDNEAKKFIGVKIANFSSDIRKTLQVCRKSLSICLKEYL